MRGQGIALSSAHPSPARKGTGPMVLGLVPDSPLASSIFSDGINKENSCVR
jgi:hypothetical protein